MSNNKSDNFIKFDNMISALTEHRDKIKAYQSYIKKLSGMAIAALNDESILANTRIEFRVKKKIEGKKSTNNPRDLLDLLTSSGTPDEFARNLDSIQDKIENNRDKEKGWEEYSIKMDDLDNITFIAVLSGIIETVKRYKGNMDTKTNTICQKL